MELGISECDGHKSEHILNKTIDEHICVLYNMNQIYH